MEELEKIHLELLSAHEKCQDSLFKIIYENETMSWVDKLKKVIDLKIYRNNISVNTEINIYDVFEQICPEAMPDSDLDISIEVSNDSLSLFSFESNFPEDLGDSIDMEEFQKTINSKKKLFICWEEYHEDEDGDDDEYTTHEYELKPDDIAKFAMIIIKKHKSMRFVVLS